MIIMHAIGSWFVHVKHADWKRVGTLLGALAAAWVFLHGIVPEPWHDYLAGILAFLSTFIASLLKAERV
jgi:predicted benzoate:H+ symporter BenE